MSYKFKKEIIPFSKYTLTADEFEDIMVESSSQDVIVCSNCFAVIDSENASDQKLTWAMDSITLKRKIKSTDGRIQVEIEKSDSDGTNLIIVPSESFTKNKLDSLSKYGIYCSHSDDIKAKLSSYFIDNLNELPVEPESSAILPISLESSDAKIFWFTIIGYLSQAIDIMLTCSAYRFVPYVRYGVAFNYLLIISSNSPNLSEIDLWQFKFVISHVLHNCFDKEKYASIALDEFIENIHKNEFEKRCLKIYKATIFLLKHQM